jgi:hypothetical protein
MGQKPPRYLQPGDTVALEVQGLGLQRQAVVASKHRIAADAASLVPSPKT